MSEPSDVLDRLRTREVTGVFHSRRALDTAAQDLLSSGFDRADIDVSASPDEQQRRLNYQAIPAADLADISAAARRPYVGRDDRLGIEVVTASVVGCVVALVMAFYLVSREMTPLTVIVVSVLSGIVAAAAGYGFSRRRRKPWPRKFCFATAEKPFTSTKSKSPRRPTISPFTRCGRIRGWGTNRSGGHSSSFIGPSIAEDSWRTASSTAQTWCGS